MEIRPDPTDVDKFVINLSKQELKNFQDGIRLIDISDSPWVKKTWEQIQQALSNNITYRSSIW